MNKRNWYLFVGALILVSVFVLAGCGGDDAATPAEEDVVEVSEPVDEPTAEPEPQILRVGGLVDADCWNNFACTAPYIWGVLVAEGFTELSKVSDGCTGEPRLAESWSVSEDGLTWTIKLKEGITFSDGTTLDANALKGYLDWMNSNESTAPWFQSMFNMVSNTVVDDLTFEYTTAVPVLYAPDADFLVMHILPPDIWGELGPDDVYMFENYPPVGTGPYVLTEHVPGSHMIFDAREDYYGGKPQFDQIVYTIYTNPDALVNALVAGEIDLTSPYLPADSVPVLESDPNITVDEKYPHELFDLDFNMSEDGIGHPAVKDPAVRMAIDYAIDKQQIVDVAFLGHASVCPTNWACGPYFEGEINPDLEVTPFDLEKANEILDEAGYVDSDNDGVRESPDGLPLKFRLLTTMAFPVEQTMGEMIADWVAEIGIQIELEVVDWGTWYYTVLEARDFDMAIDQRISEYDASNMDFWMSCWAAGPGGFNSSGWCNPDKDNLVYAYMFSDDEDFAREMIYEAQRILNEERPFIVLAGLHALQAYRNDRFEFPSDVCPTGMGLFEPSALRDVIIK